MPRSGRIRASALQGGLLMAQATRSVRPLELALNMARQHMTGHRRVSRQDGADQRPAKR